MNDFVLGNEEMPGANRAAHRAAPAGRGHRPRRSRCPTSSPSSTATCTRPSAPTRSSARPSTSRRHLRGAERRLRRSADRRLPSAGACSTTTPTRTSAPATASATTASLDMFREPKFAAYVYASQGDPDERRGAEAGDLLGARRAQHRRRAAADRADQLRRGRVPLRRRPARSASAPTARPIPHLPHPPVVIDHRHLQPRRARALGHALEGPDDHRLPRRQAGRGPLRMVADPVPTTPRGRADATTLGAAETRRGAGHRARPRPGGAPAALPRRAGPKSTSTARRG